MCAVTLTDTADQSLVSGCMTESDTSCSVRQINRNKEAVFASLQSDCEITKDGFSSLMIRNKKQCLLSLQSYCEIPADAFSFLMNRNKETVFTLFVI